LESSVRDQSPKRWRIAAERRTATATRVVLFTCPRHERASLGAIFRAAAFGARGHDDHDDERDGNHRET
jgi:hypothetical protein